jgi:CheY-like chemotaxis protein/HPt (histidine-containing phosphotransfer) domain-containing protein
MWVESEGMPGQGSIFHFTIQAPVTQLQTPRPHRLSAQPQLEGKHVLIVDDNATNRQILSRQVQAWGMLPQDTASPYEALTWVNRGDPLDVALLDLQMPELDGITLATEIHRLRKASQLPVVILSSLGSREARWEGVELAAYLLKPVKSSQLYNTLVGIFGAGETALITGEQRVSQFDNEMGKRHPLAILLAEDNANNQKLALLVLDRLGYRADVVANGLEVLQSLRRQHYDLVLMDVQMPEMDGLEATRAIAREFPAERRPRVVAMTANAMKEDRDECFAAGMDDFMTKPVQINELVAALNRCQARGVVEVNKRLLHPPEPASGFSQGKTSVPSSQTTTGAVMSSQVTAEPAPPVLDPAALQRLRINLGKQADAMLPGLINDFIAEAPRLITEAHRCLSQNRATDLRRAAHTLKSNSATFGAMALSALARELEYSARDNDLEGAGDLLARIETENNQARLALQAWLGPEKE